VRDSAAQQFLQHYLLERDESTLALLDFHLHFCLIRKSAEWIQGLWETVNERYPAQ